MLGFSGLKTMLALRFKAPIMDTSKAQSFTKLYI